MKVLIIVAHPDDEVLGVGGTILKHNEEGDEVYVCIVTKAYEPEWSKSYINKKIEEQKNVDLKLKIKRRINLDFPTVKLNTLPTGVLNKAITKVVDEIKPDVVYTHFEGDLNKDHGLVFEGSMVATRPPKNIKLICIETLSETEWGQKAFVPNYWVDISKFITQKLDAFSIYKSEVKDYPHPRSLEGIKNLSKKRGNEVCYEYGEAFIIMRDYK